MKIEILCWRCLHSDVNVMREKKCDEMGVLSWYVERFCGSVSREISFFSIFRSERENKGWLSSRKQSPSFYASLLCENSRYGCAKPARSCISLPPEKVNLPLFIFWQRKMFNFFRGSVISEIARISFREQKRKKYGGGKDWKISW